jgi:hypothetical protein
MNPFIASEDPDCRVHAAWLAQVSKAGDRLLAKEAGGSTRVSTSAAALADRLARQEVRLASEHHRIRRGQLNGVACRLLPGLEKREVRWNGNDSGYGRCKYATN